MSDTPLARRHRTRVIRVVLAAAILVVLVVVGFRWWREQKIADALEQFQTTTAPLVARGEPLGVFDRERAERFDENGAEPLVAAIAALHYEVGDSMSWPAGPWSLDDDVDLSSLDADRRAALAAFVAERSAFFQAVDAAAAKPALAFPATRDDNGNLEWAPFQEVMLVGELLSARASVAPTEDERLAAIEASLRIGRHWRPRSALEGLVAAQFLDRGAKDLCAALAAGSISAGPAARRLMPLLSPDALPIFRDTVLAERTWLLSLYNSIVDLPHVDDEGGESLISWEDVAPEDMAVALASPQVVDSATEVVELVEVLLALPTEDHLALEDAVAAATADLRTDERSWVPWNRVRELLGRGMAAMASRVPPSLARVDARLRVARIALAATELHERNGAWPRDITELEPAFEGGVPVDPRTGEPFAFTVGDDGVLRVGGTAESDGDEIDIVWTSPR